MDHTPNSEAPERCPACFTDYVERAMLSPDIFLLEGPDGWLLLEMPGESDDLLARLGTTRPYPDPWPTFGDGDEEEESAYIETEEGAALFAAANAWLDIADKAVTWPDATHPLQHWRRVQSLIGAGFNPEATTGVVELGQWVFDAAGRALEKASAQ